MRRALLAAVLAAPALARAQVIASGAIQFSDGPSDLVHGRFISAAECASATAQVNLSWNTALMTGVPSFPPSARYKVYASNKEATAPDCITENNGTDTFAGQVGATITAIGQIENLQPFSTSEFVARSGRSCTAGDTPIYVCVQAYLSDGTTKIGYAKGTLTVSTSAPGAPAGASAVPADTGALEISWSAPAGDPIAYDYRIHAESPDDPNPHDASDLRTLSYIMDNLTLGATYTIDVYARSEAGNEGPKTTATGKAVKVANFWDVCHDAPYNCPEAGGCGLSQTGAAGAASVALLAVAALLAKLRRRA